MRSSGAPLPIDGMCDRRFEPVRDAFIDNFTGRGEIGGAVCISVDGTVVADLWGGYADQDGTRPWTADTLVNVFSVGKGLVALLVARMMGRGQLDVDAPVATTWPEFARAGKADITVRQVLSHQAGLPAVRRRLPRGAMFDWQMMTDVLAEEEPWWVPGTAHGYHTNTFGFLVGELIRRATGSMPGQLLRDEITGPLDADVHLGLPSSEDRRVAHFGWNHDPPPEEQPPGLEGEVLMRYNAYFNPSGLSGAGVVNTRAWRAAEIPSTNTHASARGIARVYTALAVGGTHADVRVVDEASLAAATTEQVCGPDRVLDRPSRFGLGFQLAQPERPLGPNPDAFGHFGAGGSLGFCDPVAKVGFGYVMNQLEPRWRNPKNDALIEALYGCLGSVS